MKFNLFLLVALGTLFASTQQCNINEEYKECSGCDQYCSGEPIACKQDCSSPGCYCQDGYVRSFDKGICIPKESCPGAQPVSPVQSPGVWCPDNEEYNGCGRCDQICNNEPIGCSQACDRPGCYCKKGYIREYEGGGCIPEDSCPVQSPGTQQCNINEEYKECSGCDQYCGGEPIACKQDCSSPGCYCQDGYVRSFDKGICIPKESCPGAQPVGPVQSPGKGCRVNEYYNSCGGCDQICNSEPRFCSQACGRAGCYCLQGYSRSFIGGICIPKSICPGAGK